MGFVSLCLGP
ncbi:TPA: hypothetical protein N0F65_009471 [Lagenidium giganteum]|uniref:Uncharacterized protein n=1 Tax=Lagenidium giganteum TaxID=4803 RepID=A0AAV2ZD68_9STRA|nr:TPA: hypothetical protein N0F65_009471 [Lagenidium giganteum]